MRQRIDEAVRDCQRRRKLCGGEASKNSRTERSRKARPAAATGTPSDIRRACASPVFDSRFAVGHSTPWRATMISFGRRQLVAGMGAAFAVGTIGSVARAAMGADDKFDLVIKGGEVLDPSQRLRGMRDIGMRYGMIEALEADIPAARADRVMNAAGRLVAPGLIDLHCARLPYGSAIGIPADELVPFREPRPRVRRRRGREQLRRLPSLHRRRIAHATLRLRAHRQHRLASFPVGELSTSTSRKPKPRRRRSRKTPTSRSASRCACRENVIAQPWHRAAQARDPRLRDRRHRRAA